MLLKQTLKSRDGLLRDTFHPRIEPRLACQGETQSYLKSDDGQSVSLLISQNADIFDDDPGRQKLERFNSWQ